MNNGEEIKRQIKRFILGTDEELSVEPYGLENIIAEGIFLPERDITQIPIDFFRRKLSYYKALQG
ncbi:MAG: hypothetical protein QGM50_04130 [Anaerolineae bacterium]|nr:hypothetical protein [Anaerolineae bacterium]MDK1082287.1 hypothetical protein [Anaerolineae bacterium]MDK1117961.1 hypothetical protein [Anaerolineae bacterium]